MRKASLQAVSPDHSTAPAATCPRKQSNRAAVLVLAAALLCMLPLGVWGQSYEICRIGFTHEAFGEVNENDAIAAMRAWTQAFMEERKIPAILEPSIYDKISDMKEALIEKTVEALNMTTAEFSQLRDLVAEDVIICGVASGSICEEYVLLVNRNGTIKTLGDLEGRTIGVLSSVRASLAMTWVDTILLREGRAPVQGFFGRIDTDLKVDNLLIPLFFGKLDACVITRSGFDLMVELNPQTGKRLEVLSSSPPLVPGVLCFRKDWDPPIRETMVAEIQYWHLSPAGRQSLALFQIDGLEAQSISGLDPTLNFIEEHRALLDGDNSPHPAEQSTIGMSESPS